uniref:Uncharacterized protein n=1 Tax=Arundo donax TaxID=35708 RepID=A0A0A9DDA6_ARUDO
MITVKDSCSKKTFIIVSLILLFKGFTLRTYLYFQLIYYKLFLVLIVKFTILLNALESINSDVELDQASHSLGAVASPRAPHINLHPSPRT